MRERIVPRKRRKRRSTAICDRVKSDYMKKEKPPWTRDQKIAAVGVVLVVFSIVVGLCVPEVRRMVGLEKPPPAPVAVTTNHSEIATAPTPTTGMAKTKIDKAQPKKRSPKLATQQTTSEPPQKAPQSRPSLPAGNVTDAMVIDNHFDGTTTGFENAGKAERVLLEGNTVQPSPGQSAQIVKNDPGGEMKDIAARNNEIKAAPSSGRPRVGFGGFQIPSITVTPNVPDSAAIGNVDVKGNCNVIQNGSNNQASPNCGPVDRTIDVPKLANALKVGSDDQPEVEVLLAEINKEATSYCSQFEDAFNRAGWSAHCDKYTVSNLNNGVDLSSGLNCMGLQSDNAVILAKKVFAALGIQCNWVNIPAGHGGRKTVLKLLIRPNH
jgi:hypothetical protein